MNEIEYDLDTYREQPEELRILNVLIAYVLHNIPLSEIDKTIKKDKQATKDIDLAVRRMAHPYMFGSSMRNKFRRIIRSRKYNKWDDLRKYSTQIHSAVQFYILTNGVLTGKDMQIFEEGY